MVSTSFPWPANGLRQPPTQTCKCFHPTKQSIEATKVLTALPSHVRFTYEIAPIFILMEHFVLEKMRHIIGFTNGDSILAPGGAISNLYSIIVARHKMFPEYKTKGMRGLPQQLVLFTSEHVS